MSQSGICGSARRTALPVAIIGGFTLLIEMSIAALCAQFSIIYLLGTTRGDIVPAITTKLEIVRDSTRRVFRQISLHLQTLVSTLALQYRTQEGKSVDA